MFMICLERKRLQMLENCFWHTKLEILLQTASNKHGSKLKIGLFMITLKEISWNTCWVVSSSFIFILMDSNV